MTDTPDRIWAWDENGDMGGWVETRGPQKTDLLFEYIRADKVQALVEVLDFIQDKITWEINPSNYGHQEVCDMNADWCEIGSAVDEALTQFKETGQ